jgi:linoleoyl-CoA desaturase
MNDPEIHSSTWEWDTAQPAEQWKHSHNYVHHQFTNVLGFDNDIGYGVLRMAREQRWSPANLGQPVYNALLALLFQWGVALHDLDLESIRKGTKDPKVMKRQLRQIGRKVRRQLVKDYVVYPALSGPQFLTTVKANATANLMRNVWSYLIIFCGHFPDGALHFTEEEIEDETRAEWYLRQMLGSANFEGSSLLHVLSGNLGYQIEHHLFPDLPSNRYAEISVRVRALCEEYGIPYTTGPLHRQYGQALRTILKLSLPNSFTSDNVPPAPDRLRRRRRTDEERPKRRLETGTWSSRQTA